MNVNKAVIAVAGWGTRMLPVTKSVEKCMLPVGTRPVVDYVVRDIVAAGIRDIYFVVGEQSSQIRSYFAHNQPLEDYLRARGKEQMLGLVEPLQGVTFHFITQPADGNYGTSVPVGLAADMLLRGLVYSASQVIR
jgi:UTP--glucose-1-phosphate uridylyltransferase